MVVEHDGHRIEVKLGRWMWNRVISYDGEEVARKRSLGDVTIDFVVTENGRNVVYEVLTSAELLKAPTIREVRRNGEPVYELWRQLAD